MGSGVDEVVDVIQHLIRNQCINDGSVESGGEVRNSDLLESMLSLPGVELETYEAAPGRKSLLAKLPGTNSAAPSLMWLAHTDVVPVSASGWDHDPFGAELIDGYVWGRGAVDMFNLTASMAVAFKEIASSNDRPAGDLLFLAVADEEAGGKYGADWLVKNHFDEVKADFVVSEWGGLRRDTKNGPRFPVTTEEKGLYWTRLNIRGSPRHGSQPLGADNALITAARIVQRIADYQGDAQISDTWRDYVVGRDFSPEIAEGLLDPQRVAQICAELPAKGGPFFHACTHTTVSPNVVLGGTKTNIIPDSVSLDVDMRTLPGVSIHDAEILLIELIGDDIDKVSIETLQAHESTRSARDTPLWDSLTRVVKKLVSPDAELIPSVMVGGTDNRFYRNVGSTAYGFGLFSERTEPDDFAVMFHGNNERVDVDSLQLTTELWRALAHDFSDNIAR